MITYDPEHLKELSKVYIPGSVVFRERWCTEAQELVKVAYGGRVLLLNGSLSAIMIV